MGNDIKLIEQAFFLKKYNFLTVCYFLSIIYVFLLFVSLVTVCPMLCMCNKILTVVKI